MEESLLCLADAKEGFAQPGRVNKLAAVPGDPAEMRQMAAQIGITRQVVRTGTRFLQATLGVLARLETRGYQLVRGYDLVRTAAQRDQELGDVLALPERYLYGPAQAGAERRKDNEALVQKTQEETEKKLRLESERKNLLSGELSGFMDSLRRFLSESDRRG